MGRIEGKVAIITGAAAQNGIGFATARAFVREGAKVLLTDLNGAEVIARAAELTKLGASAIGAAHDVRREAAWNEILALAIKSFGRLDILYNNAGIVSVGAIEQTTVEQLAQVMETNVTSVFLGCKTAIAQFRLQGGGGAIVNMSSAASMIGVPHGSIYGASKAAVCIFSKCIAAEVAAEKIRVNTVHPGAIRTNMFLGSASQDAGVAAITTPLGGMGEPDDVASMVLYLASDEAKYITGGEYVVDGGLTAI